MILRYIWCMPYILTIATVFATLFVFSSLTNSSAASRKPRQDVSTSRVSYDRPTRLRAQQPTLAQKTVRGGVELRHANVEVTNVGSSVASGIQVYLEQAGGIAYSLRGPTKLQPRERGLYTMSKRVIGNSGGWSVVARCSNCRR